MRQPKIFLFDEPLSNLDAALRATMRVELARLHRRLNATIVYVTHDQAEALTLGEKIIVLDQGTIQQIDSAVGDLSEAGQYHGGAFRRQPADESAGRPLDDDGVIFHSGELRLDLSGLFKRPLSRLAGQALTLGIRAEDLQPTGDQQRLVTRRGGAGGRSRLRPVCSSKMRPLGLGR